MKGLSHLSLHAIALAVLMACGPESDTGAEIAGMGSAIAEPPILDELDTWPRIEAPDDLAQLDTLREGWEDAFAAGDSDALEFVFARDAVMTDLASLVGEDAASSDVFFDRYDADFSITNADPIEYGNWGSYYADYALTLTPTDGGPLIEDSGDFMVRLRREDAGPFSVFLGPDVGDPAPDFTLNRMDGTGSVELSALRDKPTVLVFGSFT